MRESLNSKWRRSPNGSIIARSNGKAGYVTPDAN